MIRYILILNRGQMRRTEIINHYLSKYSHPTSYLEIGINNPNSNFNSICADHKDGVDPINISHECNYHMTSDEVFAQDTTK